MLKLVIGMQINRLNAKGFTLIEVLVVLIIIGVMAAVTVGSFGHFGRSRHEKMLIEQFQSTLQSAKRKAIFTPVILRLMITQDGYTYAAYQVETHQWSKIQDTALQHPSVFRHYLSLRLFQVGGQENSKMPVVILAPSGYVTPFVLVFQGVSHHYKITVNNVGHVDTQSYEK